MFANTPKDNIIAEVKQGANRAGNDIRQAANNVRNEIDSINLEDAAHDIGKKMHHYMDNASHEMNMASDKITHQIRSNPLQSTLIALGTGFLFGLFARR